MPPHKPHNSLYSLTPGDIHWLPKQDQLPSDLVTSLHHLEPGCFGHPIVILSTTTTTQTAQVYAITSLGGKPFEAYCHHKPLHTRHQHIPIHPALPHPDTGQQLHLQASSRSLEKPSYVKTGKVIVLPRAAIDCGKSARRGPCRLDPLSLQELRHVVDLATGAPKKRKLLGPVTSNRIAPAVQHGVSDSHDSAPRQYFVPGQWESVPLAAHGTEGQRGGYRTALPSSTVRVVRDVEAADAAAQVLTIRGKPRKPSRMAVQVLVIAACVFLVLFAVWYSTGGLGIGSGYGDLLGR